MGYIRNEVQYFDFIYDNETEIEERNLNNYIWNNNIMKDEIIEKVTNKVMSLKININETKNQIEEIICKKSKTIRKNFKNNNTKLWMNYKENKIELQNIMEELKIVKLMLMITISTTGIIIIIDIIVITKIISTRIKINETNKRRKNTYQPYYKVEIKDKRSKEEDNENTEEEDGQPLNQKRLSFKEEVEEFYSLE